MTEKTKEEVLKEIKDYIRKQPNIFLLNDVLENTSKDKGTKIMNNRENRLKSLIEQMILSSFLGHRFDFKAFVEQISELRLFDYEVFIDRDMFYLEISEVDSHANIDIEYFWEEIESKLVDFDETKFESESESLIEKYIYDRNLHMRKMGIGLSAFIINEDELLSKENTK